MRVLAITAKRYERATRRVVGKAATIISSPPSLACDVTPAVLAGYDAIYIDLRGEPGAHLLYGDERPALNIENVRASRLAGCVVVATTCFLPDTPFIEGFLAAGARAVIGGWGLNWGTRSVVSGAQLLARYVIRWLQAGDTPELALHRAKTAIKRHPLRLFDRRGIDDALAFSVWHKEKTYGSKRG